MNELPEGWEAARLGDLTGDISYGFTTSATTRGPFPKLLRITDIQDGKVDWNTVPRCTDAPDDQRALTSGDIVIARTGATTGKSYLIDDLPERAVFASYLIRVRLAGEIEPKYAWAFMQSDDYWAQIQTVSKGTAQPGANASILAGLAVPVPPLPEQRRIVAKIDSLTARSRRARDHLDHIPRLVEKYKQAILAAAFRGDLTREWRRRKKVDWREVSIGQIAVALFDGPFGSNLKSADYVEGGVRVVRLENIGHLRFIEEKRTYISMEKYEGLQRHTLRPQDVLVSSFVADQMRVCLFPATLDEPSINKADCFCIRVDPGAADPRFVAYRLASAETFRAFEDQVHGATRPRISLSQLRSLAVNLPALEEQALIVDRVEAAFSQIDRLAAEATSARKLIDRLDQSVLAKAFRGELVPQDPKDEPASVLLERIKAERSNAPKQKRRGKG